MSDYKYGGARVLVALHDRHLRAFVETWRRADAMGVELPVTANPDYASREVLLAHVLRCAARYLTWICEQLELPSPGLDERPDPDGFADRAQEYLEEVLAAWQIPLRDLTEGQADMPAYTSRWGTPYSIDAMLEHAVMHPIRHAYQLEGLMREKGRVSD
jgi:uncharacterized damage-inducible protein DinB